MRHSLPNKSNRARETILANYHVRLDAFAGPFHVHRQPERHQRGSWKLDAHKLPAVQLIQRFSVDQRKEIRSYLDLAARRVSVRRGGFGFDNRLYRADGAFGIRPDEML